MSKIAGPLAKRTNRDQIAQDCLDTLIDFPLFVTVGTNLAFLLQCAVYSNGQNLFPVRANPFLLEISFLMEAKPNRT